VTVVGGRIQVVAGDAGDAEICVGYELGAVGDGIVDALAIGRVEEGEALNTEVLVRGVLNAVGNVLEKAVAVDGIIAVGANEAAKRSKVKEDAVRGDEGHTDIVGQIISENAGRTTAVRVVKRAGVPIEGTLANGSEGVVGVANSTEVGIGNVRGTIWQILSDATTVCWVKSEGTN
jgi:hypothetical protein